MSLLIQDIVDEARANLERAVRIEPRNPLLWQELARVQLEQGQYRQAENMAAKSNTLAGGRPVPAGQELAHHRRGPQPSRRSAGRAGSL
ncbi:MAG: tetratricopeptide repeat protein [Desulfobacteraceae bacterium]|jgi:predicted Zn-dependent protease